MTVFTLAGQFQDALVTALQARAGLTDVDVRRAPLGDSSEAGDKFLIGYVEGGSAVSAAVDWDSSGAFWWNEIVEIECLAVGYDLGAGDDAIKGAYDRAYEIISEVWDEIALNADHNSGAASRPLLLDEQVYNLKIPRWGEERFTDHASFIRLTISFEAGPLERS